MVLALAPGRIVQAHAEARRGWRERREVTLTGHDDRAVRRGEGHVGEGHDGLSRHRLDSDRDAGDVAEVVANPAKANAELDWRTTRTLAEACRDSWAWQSANPRGYADGAQYEGSAE